MPISVLAEVTGYAFRGGGGSGSDLTAPPNPAPVTLAAGSTALGSTLVGSWSASVTVSSLVLASGGPAPTATITGSGAGPYSVSIASGLSDATSYLVILTGTGTDGQVASTSLLVAVAAPADLTAPASPAPVSLAPGTTALGSTALGSWSAPVAVAAAAAGSDGSTPAVTLTGSGAGPYSVSIASGLSDGVTYTITATGTGADGQVAPVALSVAVRTPATVVGTYGWVTFLDYDFTTVDTGPGTTVASGSLALTVGGAPFLTLTGISGSGTGSIVPVNGQGIVVSGTGTRAFLVDLDYAALGLNIFRRIIAIEWEVAPITLTASSQGNAMVVSVVSGASTDSNFGARLVNTGASNFAISARSWNAAVSNAGTEVTFNPTLPALWSSSSLRCPEGLEVCQSAAALPANPDLHTYVGRRRSQNDNWGSLGGSLIMGSDPRPAFSLVGATASPNEMRVRRLRVQALGVV